MKKSELRKLVLEVMAGGYEPDEQGNLVPHSDKFDSTKLSSILLKVAKRRPEEEGQEAINEEQGQVFTKQELIDYLNSLEPEMEVVIPKIHMSGAFDSNVGWVTTAAEAAEALNDTPKEGEFKLWHETPRFKKFSLIQSPGELEKRTKFMQDFGGLD